MYMTDVVKHLLIINVLMFIAGFVVETDFLALYFPASDMFRPYQLVSHFFMHGGLAHIFFNMFALVMFGSALEMVWGPRRFLFYYLFCAFGAATLHMFVNYLDANNLMSQLSPEAIEIVRSQGRETLLSGKNYAEPAMAALNLLYNTPVVGASGAIFGLLLAFGILFPNQELMLIFLPIPIKAKYFIPILMLIELFLGVKQFSWDNIAHFAHLGGALFGLLLILFWRSRGERLY
jgi:membrane associated rhomboid family serine protease